VLKVIGIDNESQAEAGIEKAVTIADDQRLSDTQRAVAISFMALRNPAPHAALLKKLIIPQEQPAVQQAALNTLGLIPDQTATEYVLQEWEALTPGIRDVSLNIFMNDTARISLLLDAIEEGKIQPTSLGWPPSARLMGLSEDNLRNRARALLTRNDEAQVNEAFQQSLKIQGKSDTGKIIYQQNCALCHQVRGNLGIAYGPDLGTVQNWLPKDIMANILAPNLSIASGYDLWAVELKNGETLQGIISSETSAAITLRTNPGVEKTINRQEIKSLEVLDMSVMPVLTSQINKEQMADLLAFLRQTN
jgi:putative heme-binding domain-containing protein